MVSDRRLRAWHGKAGSSGGRGSGAGGGAGAVGDGLQDTQYDEQLQSHQGEKSRHQGLRHAGSIAPLEEQDVADNENQNQKQLEDRGSQMPPVERNRAAGFTESLTHCK